MSPDELRQYARDLVADWPPLTDAQRARLSALLRPMTSTPAVPRRAAEQKRAA